MELTRDMRTKLPVNASNVAHATGHVPQGVPLLFFKIGIMRNRRPVFIVLIMVVASTATALLSFRDRGKVTNGPATDPQGVAVVELFTSEGCSSCPPADAALKDLVERSTKEGRKVYALAFHVDYWNRLGWKDAFSDHAWSERQRGYADRLPGGVYTPQCVVNGKTQFVGSDRSDLDAAVGDARATPVKVTIDAKASLEGSTIDVEARITGDASGTEMIAVLVEDGLASAVKSGENAGKHLAHAHVVRSLSRAPITDGTTRVQLDASAMSNLLNAHVTVFAQTKGQGAIIGAAEAVIERSAH